MASSSIYKGSPCKTNCSGHRAGARYARAGGTTPSKSSSRAGGTTPSKSSSFNNGMKIAQGTFKRPKKRK